MTPILELSDVSLKPYNSLQLEAKAACLAMPLDQASFITLLRDNAHKKLIILGKGSNILLAKEYYDESYLFIVTTLMNKLEIINNEMVLEAGVSLSELAWFTVAQSILGYEFTEDIPGTIGGALIMNAGQYEYTIGQTVNWIDVYCLDTNEVRRIKPSSDFFLYRHSHFLPTEVILSCGLAITLGNDLESLEKVLTYKRERYRKQPRNYPNAGSVFKRPTKNNESLFVWKLFEELGLRGYRINDAEISYKHPGFIINLGQAKIEDVLKLIQHCQTCVKERYDVDLQLEWRIID
ncbi:MAG: UDP-N-acetylmuramate dehydrogenase [Erysipelotrichaceae bacterium]